MKFETVIQKMSNKEMKRHERITMKKGLNLTTKIKNWIKENHAS